MKRYITNDEEKYMKSLVEAVNSYIRLDIQHPSERKDFIDSVHRCQDLIAVRVARRVCPDVFPTYDAFGNKIIQ